MATDKPSPKPPEAPPPSRGERLLACFARMREAAVRAPVEARAEREYLQASVDAQLVLAAVQLETLTALQDIGATLRRIEQQGLAGKRGR